jgi:hypothetical protein
MNYRLCWAAAVAGLSVLGTTAAHAIILDFESAPLQVTRPSTYAAAGARRDLTVPNLIAINGGTVLSQETFLPANRSTLYGSAFFGPETPVGNPYLPAITLTFSSPITNFFLDVYNGQVFDVTYTMSDNAGHSSSFLLAPNLSSGTTQIGFAAAGDVITLTSDAGRLWDFSIDNIGFNQALPSTIPSTVLPPPAVADPSLVTLVAQNTLPPAPTLTPEQREIEGLDNQRRRGRGQGNNGRPLEFRLEAQGLDPNAVPDPDPGPGPAPGPLPLPGTLGLLATGLGGLGAFRRRRA